MTDRERRSSRRPLQLMRAADGTPTAISGYAAVFHRADDPGTEYQLWDDMVERIMPGAFDSVAREDVAGLFNHDPSQLLASTWAGTMELDQDGVGLRYRIPVDMNHPKHRDLVPMLERGDLAGSSFSFQVAKGGQRFVEQEDGRLVREITRVSPLFDVGPVTFPAYTATTAGVRTQDVADDVRREAAAWRARRTRVAVRTRLLDLDGHGG
jgi:HK97 family phage prohead protease